LNRDDLLEVLFGDDVPPVSTFRNIEENDEDNRFVVHTRAVIGLRARRYVVRREFAPGAGIGEAATTISTSEIVWIGVDPDHRGKGHARNLLAGTTEEAMTHALTLYLTTHAPYDCVPFFEHFEFEHPEHSPPGFMVLALTEEPWPDGRIIR
jgi:GNAT superfamily N-acetyltransferase